MRRDDFPHQLRREVEHRTRISPFRGMRDAIGFMLIEEQRVIRIRHDFRRAQTLRKNAAAHDYKLVNGRCFLRTPVMPARPAADIADGHRWTSVELLDSKLRDHVPAVVQPENEW